MNTRATPPQPNPWDEQAVEPVDQQQIAKLKKPLKEQTPDIEYDQHPLIACTELFSWGFKAINFHWRQSRNYTWEEIAGKLHVVEYNELDEMLSIPYAKFRLNK